jgi:hypothetical protein
VDAIAQEPADAVDYPASGHPGVRAPSEQAMFTP